MKGRNMTLLAALGAILAAIRKFELSVKIKLSYN